MASKTGLYDPAFEHDACGIGFVTSVKGHKSHQHITDALTVLENMEHRGACGCESNTGDGAGILFQTPHAFLRAPNGLVSVGFWSLPCLLVGVLQRLFNAGPQGFRNAPAARVGNGHQGRRIVRFYLAAAALVILGAGILLAGLRWNHLAACRPM